MESLLQAVKAAISDRLCSVNTVIIGAVHYDYRRSQLIVQSKVNSLHLVTEHNAFTGDYVNGRLFSAFGCETDGLKEAVQYFDRLVAGSNSGQYRNVYHDPDREYYDMCAYEAAHIFTQSMADDSPDFEKICDMIRAADLEPLDVFDRFKYDGTGADITEVIAEMSED